MKELLKKLAFKLLPKSLLQKVRKKHYVKKLQHASLTDEKDLQALSLLLKPGQTALDIGANFGIYARFLSEQVGSHGKVFSFEPIPPMFDVLKNNVNVLKLQNVIPVKHALSDKIAEVQMQVPEYKSGGDNFYEAKITENNDSTGKTFNVQTTTLDAFCTENNIKPNFIKIDVEGHELSCLKGAFNVLRSYKPVLMIEVNDDPEIENGNAQQVFSLLQSQNYGIYVFDGKNFNEWKAGQQEVNYFFFNK